MTSVSAQVASPVKYEKSDGIGDNKYLKSQAPNADGEYTLRLETFVTNEARNSVPTDYVLVLDGSKTMLNDYSDYFSIDAMLARGENPDYIDWATNDDLPDSDPRKLVDDSDYAYDGFTRYDYTYMYNQGAVGDYIRNLNNTVNSGPTGYFPYRRRPNGTNNPTPNPTGTARPGTMPNDIKKMAADSWNYGGDSNVYSSSRWYKSNTDHRYYRIYHGQKDLRYDGETDSKNRYFLYYMRYDDDGHFWEYRYLYGDGSQHNEAHFNSTFRGRETSGYPPKAATSCAADGHSGYEFVLLDITESHKIYRPKQRREVMLSSVEAFVYRIESQNSSGQWASGVDKNTVALASFSDDFEGSADKVTESTVTTPDNTTKVVKGFTEVTASNKDDFKSVIDTKVQFRGNKVSYFNRGLTKALKMLQNRQTQSGKAPLNESDGINRNKVVILFTDDYPGTTAPSNTPSETNTEADLIKKPRTTYAGSTTPPEINGKIYTIKLPSNDAAMGTYLEHLSSNYPEGKVSSSSTAWDSSIGYTTTTATNTGYYRDASNYLTTDLPTVMESIADASATEGTNARLAEANRLVMVDKLSDSFVFPASLSGKVTYYTAACTGSTTIDGQSYLTFANPVAVSSPSITYSVNTSTKTISFSGYNFGDAWCGSQNGTYSGYKLIIEFPVKLASGVAGSPGLPTNDGTVSGVYNGNGSGLATGARRAAYPMPTLLVPITLLVRKTGLKAGESASFTLQRKEAGNSIAAYEDFTSFVLTGEASAIPEVWLLNLDPTYHYRIKETGWSWSYTGSAMSSFPSTENTTLTAPYTTFTISNTYQLFPVNRAETKGTNNMTANNQ